MDTFISDLSHQEFPVMERVSAKTIRHPVLHLMQKDNPAINHNSFISIGELNEYQQRYITNYLTREVGKLDEPEKTVLNSMSANATLSDKLDSERQPKLTAGQKIADKVATFGGSWKFIIAFMVFILVWIAINIYWLANTGFDPYPFILLNLILSCVASIQAPVIMMSQNRQEEKDRERAKNDYMINLKSELEIRSLHEKVDHFIMDQQQELFELQKLQVSMMNEIVSIVTNNAGSPVKKISG